MDDDDEPPSPMSGDELDDSNSDSDTDLSILSDASTSKQAPANLNERRTRRGVYMTFSEKKDEDEGNSTDIKCEDSEG